MSVYDPAASRLRRLLDKVLFAWVACAAPAVLIAAGFGLLDLESRILRADPVDGNPAAVEETATATVNLSEVGAGELLAKGVDRLIPLPVLDIKVRLDVAGIMVHGTVTQKFENPTDDVIEAVYVFPLPENAAVHSMEMMIGSRLIHSVIQEREQARKTYEAAKKEGRKAALVEQERPNLFTTSAANINPGEQIEVTLEYIQELTHAGDELQLDFPLTFTPRFVPGPATTAEAIDGERITSPFVPPGSASVPRAKMEVRIMAGLALADVRCLSHPVRTWWDGETIVIEPVEESIAADRDFRLRWALETGEKPSAAVLVEDGGEDRYALMMLLPPADEFSRETGLPTETVFVVDVSGSMDGSSIVQAREALMAALDRLRPDDRFAILAFDDEVYEFRNRFAPAHAADLEDARRWVRALRADGGTMIHPALMRGIGMFRDDGSGRVRRIVFLTDGAVGNEGRLLAAVRGSLGKTRLHTLGIGSAPNRYLMRKMAAAGGGLCEFISASAEAGNRVDKFFRRLDRPVATDLVLEWEGVRPWEVYPENLPDLHAGEPLFVSARFAPGQAQGRVILRGRISDGEFRTVLDLRADAPEDSGVAVRWARAKVGALMDSLHEGAGQDKVRAAVIRISKMYRIITRYTSLVAVEEFPSAWGDARTVRVPNSLPDGAVLPTGGSSEPLILLIAIALLASGGAALLIVKTGWR